MPLMIIDDFIDIKECMPMSTKCPICHNEALNIYASTETNYTVMESQSTHEYAVKSDHFSIVYTHQNCLNANS